MDDSDVVECSSQEALSQLPYMLFYERVHESNYLTSPFRVDVHNDEDQRDRTLSFQAHEDSRLTGHDDFDRSLAKETARNAVGFRKRKMSDDYQEEQVEEALILPRTNRLEAVFGQAMQTFDHAVKRLRKSIDKSVDFIGNSLQILSLGAISLGYSDSHSVLRLNNVHESLTQSRNRGDSQLQVYRNISVNRSPVIALANVAQKVLGDVLFDQEKLQYNSHKYDKNNNDRKKSVKRKNWE